MEQRTLPEREDKAYLANLEELQRPKQAFCSFLLQRFLLKISLQLWCYCLLSLVITCLYPREHKACKGFCNEVSFWISLKTNSSGLTWPTFRFLFFGLNLNNRGSFFCELWVLIQTSTVWSSLYIIAQVDSQVICALWTGTEWTSPFQVGNL